MRYLSVVVVTTAFVVLVSDCGQGPAFRETKSSYITSNGGSGDATNGNPVASGPVAAEGNPTAGPTAAAPNAGPSPAAVPTGPAPAPMPPPAPVNPNPDGKTSIDGTTDGFRPQSEGPLPNPDRFKSFRMGLLVNEPRCAMCHLQVNGDVAATADVVHWNLDAAGVMLAEPTPPDQINGSWFCARSFSAKATDDAGHLSNTDMPITATGGIKENYTGPELPMLNGVVQFPAFDAAAVQKSVQGSLTGKSLVDGSGVTVTNVYTGNLALGGDKQAPIEISGDVFVSGDLVLKGYYTGVGSIYVGGRVYIPADLRAVHSVFPYPADRVTALALAVKHVTDHTGDALGIATMQSVFIADLGSALYDDPGMNPPRIPPETQRAVAGVDEVYSWYPGGKAGYDQLYEASISCNTSGPVDTKSFNLVEAYLYAAHAVAGISRQGSWAINGGVISNSLHIIGRGGRSSPIGDNIECTAPTASPVHGYPMNANYVNYDWRMAIGLRLLSKMAAYYDH